MKFVPFPKGQKGFTLVELLVVISIIGLLSSVVFASLSSAKTKARDARRISDLHQITVALELYFDKYGYYPQSSCGWDCGGYRYSTDSSWNSLASDLAEFMPTLPKDSVNNFSSPWFAGHFSYAYGNVGKSDYSPQYDLTAQLEDTSSPLRCTVKNYHFYFDSRSWCPPWGGGYSGQIYEASPM